MEEVFVTRTFLPAVEEIEAKLSSIWKSGILTNNGVVLRELEERLRNYLHAPGLVALNNGTVALQLAIRALDVRDEVIVTPFSYVATVSSAVWEKCTPVFADIDPTRLTIDPRSVEHCITKKTTAILATHVFGNPCDVNALRSIADRHGLKLIYDGAHSFGVKVDGAPITSYGDVTTLSFHATKLFHTVEGGAAVASDPEVVQRLAYMRNFGHAGPEAFQGIGINGKMSEVHAAIGHLVLDHIDHIISSRKGAWLRYRDILAEVGTLQVLNIGPDVEYNYAYFPVLFRAEQEALRVISTLNAQGVYPRRYFYPSLDTLPYCSGQVCPISRDISSRILCLPLFADMDLALVDRIGRAVRDAISKV
ncbi:MAG: DegT/DnrJ/EryC1/StrS family aminotransferase [Flavobacteriales bacterium]|nr:DegT/DnrJ/EryC1/StrS family aminotransferase [Flavobacteriales bacterium]